MISTSERQITLLYHTKTSIAKQTLVYARTHGLRIREVNVLKAPLTGGQIAGLAYRLGIKISELINHKHHTYTKKFNFKVLSSEDWITMIKNHPKIMKQPIAMLGNRTILVETPTDIIRI